MKGKIVKGIAGFYYVDVVGSGVYECKARGVFRKEKRKPLVGDNVEIEVLDEKDREGNITEILPRKNELVRPAAANVDQALVVFAVAKPDPHFHLLDRFLVMMERKEIPVILCFNKDDLGTEERIKELRDIYRDCGCTLVFASAGMERNIEEIRGLLAGKTTVIAGPSGVGKSSLTNQMQDKIFMETGDISKKLGRGRHTTRHSQIIPVCKDTFLVDTPGFTSLYLENMEKEELKEYFAEFRQYEEQCKFQGCAHIHEPECGVKEALKEKKISEVRYKNYIDLYEELKEKRRY